MTLPLLLSDLVTADTFAYKLNPVNWTKLLRFGLLASFLPFFEPFFEPLDKDNILRYRSIRRGLHPGLKLLDIRG
jgi:hypothetical protein